MMKETESLQQLHRMLQSHYDDFRKGKMDQEAYLKEVSPLDRQIDRLELSSLFGSMAALFAEDEKKSGPKVDFG
jgi:hypothetical protein